MAASIAFNDSEIPQNLVSYFMHRAKQCGARPALWRKVNQSYQPILWKDLARHVEETAAGFFDLGIRKGDRVALLSENRPEWVLCDMAIMSLGAVTVPIYPTSSLSDIRHILNDSQAKVLIVSTQERLECVLPLLNEIHELEYLLTLDSIPQEQLRVHSLKAIAERGVRILFDQPELIQENLERVTRDDLATLIYTSGTTGAAKGVMLTHGNFIANYQGCRERITIDPDDIAMSFLPLSHVFERLAGYYFMLFSGASIAYAESMLTVVEDMALIHPTVAPAVPRFYEKVYLKIRESLLAQSLKKQKIFEWAVQLGFKVRSQRLHKESVGLKDALLFVIAERLVHRKIQKVFGGRMRFFISGGAPLSKELAEFFFACGVLILEGYGLTETSPVIGVNDPATCRFGTIGRPLVNVQVKIAEDGEVLVKGPSVMKGYFRNEEATKAAFLDGWFCTGDIGELDQEGYLHITDRKKDIIKTSGGKMIAPQNIERMILMDPLYSQIVLVGDKKQYLVALIVPNRERLSALAAHWGVGAFAWEDLLKHPRVLAELTADLKKKTAHLASFEQIKYFALLPKEFSMEAGEMTPTLKIKRRFVQEKYRDLIDVLYAVRSESNPGDSQHGR